MCLVLCGHVLRKGFNGESGSSISGGFELSLIIVTLGMLRPVGVGEPPYCWPCLPFFPGRLRGECGGTLVLPPEAPGKVRVGLLLSGFPQLSHPGQ